MLARVDGSVGEWTDVEGQVREGSPPSGYRDYTGFYSGEAGAVAPAGWTPTDEYYQGVQTGKWGTVVQQLPGVKAAEGIAPWIPVAGVVVVGLILYLVLK